MKPPRLDHLIDERFLAHRLRSSSTAGIVAGSAAALLFGWRYYVNGIWSSDLLAVVGLFIVVKWALMAWYRFRD